MDTKRLYVMRHGKSDWGEPGLSDPERGLTKRGKRDSDAMGRLMLERGQVPELLVCSPARRARLTAKRLAVGCEFAGETVVHDGLYDGGLEGYLLVIQQLPDDVDRALIMGHNPASEELVEALTGESVTLPTASVACVDFKKASWAQARPGMQRATLRFVWRPKEVLDVSQARSTGED
jgi:phosphohistidine phosphatase